jgi:hypothetical protein
LSRSCWSMVLMWAVISSIVSASHHRSWIRLASMSNFASFDWLSSCLCCTILDGRTFQIYSAIMSTSLQTVVCFVLQPNKVVNHIFSPLMVACCAHSLKCMKLLVEVELFVGSGILLFHWICCHDYKWWFSLELSELCVVDSIGRC